jgi:hypothetical protein
MDLPQSSDHPVHHAPHLLHRLIARRALRRCGALTLVAMVTLSIAPCGHSAEEQWPDVEAQIQYGFLTEAPHELANLAARLEQQLAGERIDALAAYYAGFANYRLALISQSRDKGAALQAAQHCVSDLGKSLAAQADAPEALALQASCLAQIAQLSWQSPLAGPKARSQMERAVHLAPRNPRVLLLDAVLDDERPKDSASRDRALTKLRKIVLLFDAERASLTPTPGWGAAEAYTYLGRSCLDHGAPAEARAALERALLLAPEFAQAKRLMGRITQG